MLLRCYKDGLDVDAQAGLLFPSQRRVKCFRDTLPSVLATTGCGRGLSETLASSKKSILWPQGAAWEDFRGSHGGKCGGAIVFFYVGYPAVTIQDHDEEPISGVYAATLHKESLYLAVGDRGILASADEHDSGVS
jgi:hypothetical protein